MFILLVLAGNVEKEDVVTKIGAVVATQGPAGLLGQSFLKAIQLAKEDLKNTKQQYELAIEEIPSPDKAEPAIQKLIKIDRVDALIVGLSMSGQIAKTLQLLLKSPSFAFARLAAWVTSCTPSPRCRSLRTKQADGSPKPGGEGSRESPG